MMAIFHLLKLLLSTRRRGLASTRGQCRWSGHHSNQTAARGTGTGWIFNRDRVAALKKWMVASCSWPTHLIGFVPLDRP